MVLQDGGWEWVDFAECYRLPSQGLPCDGGGFDAAEQADVAYRAHASPPMRALMWLRLSLIGFPLLVEVVGPTLTSGWG